MRSGNTHVRTVNDPVDDYLFVFEFRSPQGGGAPYPVYVTEGHRSELTQYLTDYTANRIIVDAHGRKVLR